MRASGDFSTVVALQYRSPGSTGPEYHHLLSAAESLIYMIYQLSGKIAPHSILFPFGLGVDYLDVRFV